MGIKEYTKEDTCCDVHGVLYVTNESLNINIKH